MSAIYAPQNTITSVATAANLTGFGAGFPPGAVAYAQDTKKYYTLDPTSTATPDGSTIVASSGTGNWLIWDTFLGLDEAISFTFSSSSPIVLGALPVGSVINRALVSITTTFNGGGASILLGTVGTPNLVLTSTDVYPGVIGQYESCALVTIASPAILQLTINPSGSSQGAGVLLYNFRQNG